MTFPNFYQAGGVLMHVITLLSLVALVAVGRRIRRLRAAFANPSAARERLARPSMTVTAIVTAIAVGVLGTLMGTMEAAAAVTTVPPDMQFPAFMRGLMILVIPGIWALMCTIPLMLAHGGLRSFESRLQRALRAKDG